MRNEDIKYFVNEEKRTVVAYIEGCRDDAYDEVSRISETYGVYISSYSEASKMPNSFRGISKCHPDDEWNEEIGKKVARRKLFIAYNEAKLNAIRGYYKSLINATTAVFNKYFKYI